MRRCKERGSLAFADTRLGGCSHIVPQAGTLGAEPRPKARRLEAAPPCSFDRAAHAPSVFPIAAEFVEFLCHGGLTEADAHFGKLRGTGVWRSRYGSARA